MNAVVLEVFVFVLWHLVSKHLILASPWYYLVFCTLFSLGRIVVSSFAYPWPYLVRCALFALGASHSHSLTYALFALCCTLCYVLGQPTTTIHHFFTLGLLVPLCWFCRGEAHPLGRHLLHYGGYVLYTEGVLWVGGNTIGIVFLVEGWWLPLVIMTCNHDDEEKMSQLMGDPRAFKGFHRL